MGETLSYFITDDRHEVESLILLVGETEETARRMAVEDLRANPHHLAVEVRVEDTLVFSLTRAEVLSQDLAGAAGSESATTLAAQ